MRYNEILTEAAIEPVSLQQAHDAGMFGPFYHGTTGDLDAMITNGLDPARSIPSDHVGIWDQALGISNGYTLMGYGYTGIAPPIHHLGFGFYGTKAKARAKAFAGGSAKGMRAFFLDSQNIDEINFGSPRTMMRWWMENGYDMTPEATEKRDVRAWKRATMNLTLTLARKFDAVYYLGKGLTTLLDGDQICIYPHAFDKIRVVDPSLSSGLDIGSKVTHTQVVPAFFKGKNSLYVDEFRPDDFGKAGKLAGTGWRGVFRADDENGKVGRYPIHFIPPPNVVGEITPYQTGTRGDGTRLYSVRWKPGGEMFNYSAEELQPYNRNK